MKIALKRSSLLLLILLIVAGCTNDSSPTPTLTETALPTDTEISTFTFTPSPTASSTPSATPTVTPSATSTRTPTITRTPSPPMIVMFRLVNANTDLEVITLEDGMVVNMPDYGIVAFNIRVVTSGQVGSMRITWGQLAPRFENGSPWSAFGDTNGDYFGMPVTPGLYRLTVQAFSGANGTGIAGQVVTLWLSIADSDANREIFPRGALQGDVPAPSDYWCATNWLLTHEKCL